MSLVLLLLVALFCVFLALNYKRNKNIFDGVFYVMGPYVVIIAVNNIVMTQFGFVRIPDSTVALHLAAMVMFFGGCLVGEKLAAYRRTPLNIRKAARRNDVDVDTVKLLLGLCHLVLLADRIYRIAVYGLVDFIHGGEYGPSTIPAHTQLLIVPLSVILLDKCVIGSKKMDRVAIGQILLTAVFLFSTFIKYHIISAVLIAFVYIALKYPRLLKKLGVFCVALVILFFVGNYLVSFIAEDLTASASFYINHLWAYIAGGTINLDAAEAHLAQSGAQVSIWKWLVSMVTMFPNMFYQKFTGSDLIDYRFNTMLVNFDLGPDRSNVVSILAAAFCQTNVVGFGIFMFAWGVVVQWVYSRANRSCYDRTKLLASVFLAFNLLSFFACFFELNNPWELMILTFLVYYVITIPVSNLWKKEKDMKKIQYSVYRKETGNAGGKAKNDASDILKELGYEQSYEPSKYQKVRILQQFLSLLRLKTRKTLVLQYPAVSKPLMKALAKCFHPQDRRIALIHDLRSLQGMGGDATQEIQELSDYDTLIVHNGRMETYLCESGYGGNMIRLELFDYLHDVDRPVQESPYSATVCFAGNLDKSSFVAQLGKIASCNFNLYGVKNAVELQGENVHYKGLLSSDEIVYLLDGDYGLIWDGSALETCEGVYGNYLRYNNPHKLSLYIAAGKPVIAWKQSAIAEFVEKNQIGIVVDSLEELNGIDLAAQHPRLKANAMKLKEKVGTGYYLKTAMEKACGGQ